MVNRIDRINSLLKEVIAEVIRKRVRNPKINQFLTVTRVETTKDLKHAKVFISLIGDEEEKAQTLKALKSAAGFIGVNAAKQVTLRFFPTLSFVIDDTVEKQMHIHNILEELKVNSSNNDDE